LNQAERGHAGFALALATGRTLPAGTRQLLVCSFAPVGSRKSTPLAIGFSDFPVRREIADVEANAITTSFMLEGAEAGVLANVSAASFQADEFAPEQIVSAFGVNLAAKPKSSTTTPLPTKLANTTVGITDSSGIELAAPLFFVSPAQINYLIPHDAAEGLATVTVANADNIVSIGTILITSVSPGLFTANADGQGVPAAVALRVKADGSQQYEPIAQFNPQQNRFIAKPLSPGMASSGSMRRRAAR